jgi:hypothetical protein
VLGRHAGAAFHAAPGHTIQLHPDSLTRSQLAKCGGVLANIDLAAAGKRVCSVLSRQFPKRAMGILIPPFRVVNGS